QPNQGFLRSLADAKITNLNYKGGLSSESDATDRELSRKLAAVRPHGIGLEPIADEFQAIVGQRGKQPPAASISRDIRKHGLSHVLADDICTRNTKHALRSRVELRDTSALVGTNEGV